MSERKLSIKKLQLVAKEEEPFNLEEEINKTLNFAAVSELN